MRRRDAVSQERPTCHPDVSAIIAHNVAVVVVVEARIAFCGHEMHTRLGDRDLDVGSPSRTLI
jgi:hypothetical protein